MQQEDDLRALAKIMDFLRAVSILLVVMHLYWYCYGAILAWEVNIGVVDRILMNFDRTAGLFRSMLYTKLFALVLLALSCLGTKGVKNGRMTWTRIWTVLGAGLVLFFLNWWILELPLPVPANTALYTAAVAAGYVCLLMAGTWMISMFPTKYSYYKLIHINIHRFQSIFITFFSDVWSLIPYNRKDSQN